MIITNIHLNNYRLYKGSNEVSFIPDEHKNVYIISGNNGFGKTSFLTSLVWCFYGKSMVDVEKKFKEDVYENGGYKRYAISNLNASARIEGAKEYSVSVVLKDIFIPSVPCEQVEIKRTYNIEKEVERLQILIDGYENELTKEVGNEIFINDFILPKEIAKFFFFDAEKIVALAEVTSIEERRALSKAYSEVIGIKKYEDLKENLENLRVRLRRTNSVNTEKNLKYDLLRKEIEGHKEILRLHDQKVEKLNEELASKRLYSEQLQEKLIREGNGLSLKQLQALREELKSLAVESERLKSQLNDLLELAPFAICSNVLQKVVQQLQIENAAYADVIPSEIRERVEDKVANELKALDLEASIIYKITSIIKRSLIKEQSENDNTLKILELNDSDKNQVRLIYSKLKNAYSTTFKEVSKAYKNNKAAEARALKKLSEAESKEKDLLIKEIRSEKIKVDDRMFEIQKEIAITLASNDLIQREIVSKERVVSEISKGISLFEMDLKKDEAAARLVNELNLFINKLKKEKKKSLEENIKFELNRLMHKEGFVTRVEVKLDNDLIDIILFKKSGGVIEKERLSKGEQQLYATALLKSLVSESNIKFPVFIDSPLQKFDKIHSHRVINEFYPTVSEQVVLFPLLEKELTEQEYASLSKRVAGSYLIRNVEGEFSQFVKVEPKQLFNSYN